MYNFNLPICNDGWDLDLPYKFDFSVEVTHYLDVKPDYRADNPDDYYGWLELEYRLMYQGHDYRYDLPDWLIKNIEEDIVKYLEEEDEEPAP